MEHLFERRRCLLLCLTLISFVLLTIMAPYHYYTVYTKSQVPSVIWKTSSPASPPSVHLRNTAKTARVCNVFSGEWVPNPSAPYYTNESCWAIHEHQNCRKYGRPDTQFLKWRWKPNDCELPLFNAAQFLEILRGKSLAFVGDSVARNHMQSLMCLLNRVSFPVDVSQTSDERFKRWSYASHSFTLAFFLSPFLVKTMEADQNGPTNTGLFNLYLDEPDDWITKVNEFDYVIMSAGQWFFRPMIFSEKKQVIGCHFCLQENITDLTKYYGYRMAFRTAFQAMNELRGFKGMLFLRTFAPSHFEGGDWNKGGNCLRRLPLRNNETRLDGFNLELYMIQIEEFRRAEKQGRDRGMKYGLMDITEAMLLRPDGHPSKYGHWPNENVTLYNDCVHWCLPGPIDAFNDFLLHMLIDIKKKES
ncbi:protein trichome birefringence-like 19 [Dioscorea cayenensis subsp. rotundata]|uniref:Protein trichome birefringence-like 19 n=1 Tax=Dioscorea cayennensis subsp. rotundata TaxID=55577 RepID=A0AB40BB63_DIOCR|nr:protein trichome birefringence-like 19 [Dioscorea cayenensis subsp. rotundata]